MREKVITILRKCEISDEVIFLPNYSVSDEFDSIVIAEIITSIEDEFNIEIDAEDIIPLNFNNIDSIADLIEKYIEG